VALLIFVMALPGAALGGLAAEQDATPAALTRSVTWEAIDVTLELREDSSIRVTERDRVAFTGGPFRTGFREIPLARIESIDNVEVGEVRAGQQVAYAFVPPAEFSRDVPETYTYQVVGPNLRIDWGFPITTSSERTFEIGFDSLGALGVYDDANPPYQQIAWIGVGQELSAGAPVNSASLTIVLPRPVDPENAVLRGNGSVAPAGHTTDGRTWTWQVHDLAQGDEFVAGLRFPSLVAATPPSWQDAADASERPVEPGISTTPETVATPAAGEVRRLTDDASEAQKLTVAHLESGTLAEGEAALSALLADDTANADAQLGLGVIRFMQAIEHLSQGLYRYGLKPPESFMAPVVRLPVPENPNPQPITYQDFRDLLQAYVDDLALAEATLAGVHADDVGLVLDLKTIRYDVDGDGTVNDDERLLAVIQRVSGLTDEDLAASLTFNFDLGDVYWLRGYCHVLMAFGEFLLAYDWQESFDASFFHFFPAMHSPFRDALKPPGDDNNDQIGPIADGISFLHIRWPVIEPDRLATARIHLKQTIALSRQSWDAIEAETDDDREWIPNAQQTSPFTSIVVDQERIAAWRLVLDEADAVLDGEKLVPHWRLEQGINRRRAFEEPQPFDPVPSLTGPAALPYLEDGPISTSEEWRRLTEAFSGSFGLFALWVN